MIRNERQYRITRAQLDEFERKLKLMAEAPADARIHPRIRQAQLDAIRSQEQELREELTAYEALRDKRSKVIELSSLDELPSALIQARIASGLTQRELADRLGMKEQQLQRYEATDYAGASLDRIRQVVAAGVAVREEVFLPHAEVNDLPPTEAHGLCWSPEGFCFEAHPFARSQEETSVVLSAATILNRILGWAPAALLGDSSLALSTAALAGARFKLPVKSAGRSTKPTRSMRTTSRACESGNADTDEVLISNGFQPLPTRSTGSWSILFRERPGLHLEVWDCRPTARGPGGISWRSVEDRRAQRCRLEAGHAVRVAVAIRSSPRGSSYCRGAERNGAVLHRLRTTGAGERFSTGRNGSILVRRECSPRWPGGGARGEMRGKSSR